MTDLEINSLAEGVFAYLKEKTEPLDTIAVLGVAAIMVFAAVAKPAYPVETFAEDFKQGLIHSWKSRSQQGSETMQ